jgi:hypothetical protein
MGSVKLLLNAKKRHQSLVALHISDYRSCPKGRGGGLDSRNVSAGLGINANAIADLDE